MMESIKEEGGETFGNKSDKGSSFLNVRRFSDRSQINLPNRLSSVQQAPRRTIRNSGMEANKILAAKMKFLGINEELGKEDLLTTNKMTSEVSKLIEEMSKPKAGLEKNIRGSKRFSVEKNNSRDADKISFLMKSLPNFKRYMTFNGVDDEALKNASYFLEYRLYKAGEYIFRQGDESKHFFGIISGRVSLRIKIKQQVEDKLEKHSNLYEDLFRTSVLSLQKNRNKKKSVVTFEEEEIFCLTDGYCFGEWGLIYKKPRSTAALVTEDTHLFVLDENSFNVSFLKCLTKSEADRKNFFLNRIKPFADLQYLKFDSIFKTFVPMFLKNNQIIFLENSPADKLFVVYMGSCSLQKNINILPEQYKKDVYKMKFITLLKIEKGDITGLDALFDKNYKYSLRADSDYTVVFSIQVHKIEDSLKEKLKLNFQSIHDLFSEHVKSIIDKKRQLAIKNKLSYRSDTIKRQINNMKLDKDEEKELEFNIGKKIMKVKEEYKKDPLNRLSNFKVFSNIENKTQSVINSNNLSSRNLYESPTTQRTKVNIENTQTSKAKASVCSEFHSPKREHSSVAYSISLDNFHLNQMLNSGKSENSEIKFKYAKSLILNEKEDKINGNNLNQNLNILPEEDREQNLSNISNKSFPDVDVEDKFITGRKNSRSKFHPKSKENITINRITDYTGLETNVGTTCNNMVSSPNHMLIDDRINIYEKRRNSNFEKAKNSLNKERNVISPKIKCLETITNFNSFNYKSKHPSIQISESGIQNMIKTPKISQPRGSFSTKANTYLRTNTVNNFHSSSSLNPESKNKGRSKNMITQGIQTGNNTINDSNVSISRRSSKSNKFYHNTTTKESEPLTLPKTVKNNLVSWTNVMSNGKSFNTGYYDIPLIGMMTK